MGGKVLCPSLDFNDPQGQRFSMGKNGTKKEPPISRHILYEASVQAPDFDAEFLARAYEERYDGDPLHMREDFSGTSLLSMIWATRSPDHRAWAVDLDKPTLDWARANRFHENVTYLQDDVRTARTPKMDVICALNFSYCVFWERADLLGYFQSAHEGLRAKGVFVLDGYGGPAAMGHSVEKKKIPAGNDWGGNPYPAFTYYWEQATYNLLDARTVCHIHFKVKGKKYKKQFTYNWRLYSMPELRDLLLEAGFAGVEMHLEGWDDATGETDGDMRARTVYEEMDSFICYLVAHK